MKFRAPLLLSSALAVACASNPYTQFYVGQTSTSPTLASKVDPGGPLQVYSGGDPETDFVAIVEDGYLLLGYSNFNAPNARRQQLVEQAQAVGASLVVVYSHYTNTVAGTVPLVLPSAPTTAVTNVQGSAQGSGGSATYSGIATTTIYGGTTTYNIPYRTDRFDQLATFWIKAQPPSLGVFARDLTAEERALLERNGGARILAVVRDSPAFTANLLRGDIILRLDGVDIQGRQHLFSVLESSRGTLVSLDIQRGKELKTIELRLRP